MSQMHLGHPQHNQSSLLAAISRALPAVTPGQLSSDFIAACLLHFTFPDTPVLHYNLSLLSASRGVVRVLLSCSCFIGSAAITHCGPSVTRITWNIADTWTLHRWLKTNPRTINRVLICRAQYHCVPGERNVVLVLYLQSDFTPYATFCR